MSARADQGSTSASPSRLGDRLENGAARAEHRPRHLSVGDLAVESHHQPRDRLDVLRGRRRERPPFGLGRVDLGFVPGESGLERGDLDRQLSCEILTDIQP
jgi:hypothetical protein